MNKPSEGDNLCWTMREIKDSCKDLATLVQNMAEEIKQREKDAIPELLWILSKCLDIGQMLRLMEGKLGLSGKCPIRKSTLSKQGKEESRMVVEFVSELPHERGS